jgi:hypothetical protein
MTTIRFIAQPDAQVGSELLGLLEAQPPPSRVTLVSAWAFRQTLLRLRPALLKLKAKGVRLSVVVGIDLGGTSKDALLELSSWSIDSWLVKNRRLGSTFHPKLFVVERPDRVDVLLGSSNLTDGGLYTNYEGVVHLRFDTQRDSAELAEFRNKFRRFLEPSGTTTVRLTDEVVEKLAARGDVASEEEVKKRQREISRLRTSGSSGGSLFGSEEIASPPPLPPEVLRELIGNVKRRALPTRRTAGGAKRKTGRRGATQPETISPNAFFMTLPKMRGRTIPGEARIPMEARDIAPEFWGWPAEYNRTASPRGGAGRIYRNWKPLWRISRADSTSAGVRIDRVRMYEYENSSDFRFYSKALLDLGADEGDIVRITRVSDPDAEYECVLASKGSPTFADWLRYCSESVRNSPRRFGYT